MKLLTGSKWIKESDWEGSHDVLTIKSVTLEKSHWASGLRCCVLTKSNFFTWITTNLNILKKNKYGLTYYSSDKNKYCKISSENSDAILPSVFYFYHSLGSFFLLLLCVPKQTGARSIGTHQWLSVCKGWQCQPGVKIVLIVSVLDSNAGFWEIKQHKSVTVTG